MRLPNVIKLSVDNGKNENFITHQALLLCKNSLVLMPEASNRGLNISAKQKPVLLKAASSSKSTEHLVTYYQTIVKVKRLIFRQVFTPKYFADNA